MVPLAGGSEDFLDLKGEMEDLEDLEVKDIDRAEVAIDGEGPAIALVCRPWFIPPNLFNFEIFRAEKKNELNTVYTSFAT